MWGWGLSIYFSFDPHNNPLRKAPLSSPFLQTIYRNFEKVFWLLVTAQRITVKLKTTNLYYVTVSVGQEFCGGLAVWLWLKVSHEVAVKMSTWKLGAGGSTSKLSLTWRLVRGLKSLPCGPFHRMPELLASLTMKDPREQPCRKLQCLLWPDLRSVTNGIQPPLLLYSIGHTKQSWYSVRGHYARAWTLVLRSLRAIFWGWLPKQLRNLLKVPQSWD